MTREEAAIALEISPREVARQQENGLLTVVSKAARGRVLYNADEVDAIRRRNAKKKARASARACRPLPIVEKPLITAVYSAEEAKLVFEGFDRGLSAADCVREMCVHPDKVETILRSYERLVGVLVLCTETVAEINELPLDGNFPITTSAGLLELLVTHSRDRCGVCQKRARHLCKGCAVPFVRGQLMRERAAEAAAAGLPPPEEDEDDV